MAFKDIRLMNIWEIVRRYSAGQSIRSIARTLDYDRKTVRKYLKHLEAKGVPPIPVEAVRIRTYSMLILLFKLTAILEAQPLSLRCLYSQTKMT